MFLNHFVEKTPYCHIDIAGATNPDDCFGFGFGFGIRMVIDFFDHLTFTLISIISKLAYQLNSSLRKGSYFLWFTNLLQHKFLNSIVFIIHIRFLSSLLLPAIIFIWQELPMKKVIYLIMCILLQGCSFETKTENDAPCKLGKNKTKTLQIDPSAQKVKTWAHCRYPITF